MAFTGSPTFVGTKHTQKITGLSLAAASSGTIGSNGDGGADVAMPSAFGSFGASDIVEVSVEQGSAGGGAGVKVEVTQAGPTGSPLRITLANTHAANASGGLIVWVKRIHTLIQ